MIERSVHVAIVAYHSANQLDRCLAALERLVPVTVVDNSSSRDVEAVVSHHGATYVNASSNLGFAGGINVALDLLAYEDTDVLLLNPDAVVSANAIRELQRSLYLPENSRVAAVSPRLLGPGGSEQQVLWPFPTPMRSWAEAVGLGHLPSKRKFAVGAVLLLRREAIEEVGLFDERFFLYAEEADWQRRACLRGWTSLLCPNVVAQHIGGGTSTSQKRREALFHAAQETYIRKWHGRLGWCFYRIAAFVGATARALIFSHDRRGEAVRRMLIYLRGPRRHAAVGGR